MRDREHRREERERERERRHEERHAFHFGPRGLDINVDVDPEEIARSVSAAFTDVDADDGETREETIEKEFTVAGMPRLRVRNVSGCTSIRAGDTGHVRVVARKHVRGGSADRARRLFENVEVRIEQRW